MKVQPRISQKRRGGSWQSSGQALGVTLIELLCVMGIIGILMSMMAPAALKALKKARQLSGEIEAPAFQEEIQRKYTPYRLANPQHPMLDLNEFIAACGLSSKAAAWLKSSEVQFFAFSGASAPSTVVIKQRLKVIPNRPTVAAYSVMDLLLPEPQ